MLEQLGLPENVMTVVSPALYFFELTFVVASVAQTEDPDVPLRVQPIDIAAVMVDEDFRKVADSCYRSKSFMGIRNHRTLLIRMIYNNGLTLNSAIFRKAPQVHCQYDSQICSSSLLTD